MHELFVAIIELVERMGYIGIFIMTFVESTFVPIPSEVTLVPAGYLISEGVMNFYIVVIASILGTVCGSSVNYYIAHHFGRKILVKYGKYYLMSEQKLQTIEFFFERHGAVSTFLGRLLPGIKHFIAFPAGLARMQYRIFLLYTTLGGAVFNTTITLLGYYLGQQKALIKSYVAQLNVILISITIVITIFFIYKHRKSKKK